MCREHITTTTINGTERRICFYKGKRLNKKSKQMEKKFKRLQLANYFFLFKPLFTQLNF